MQVALDAAFYVLGGTFAIGLLLLGWLGFDLWFGDRFRTPHPDYVRLPCTALDAARNVYDQMKVGYAAATAKERRYLDVHLRRMEERVQYLEDKTLDEHAGYYKAVGRRERLWRGWKALHEQIRLMSRADRKRAQPRLDEARIAFTRTDAVVREEWSHGIYRDKLMMEELRSLGLLEETYLPKLLEQVRAHTAAGDTETEDGAWQEPGVEPGVDSSTGSGSAVRQRRFVEDENVVQDVGQASANTATPKRSNLLSYGGIREALAPLFGQKAPRPEPAVIPQPEAVIAPSDWKPAPPPPRVEDPLLKVVAASIAADPTATAPNPSATSAMAAPALLRQGDLLSNGLIAPGRRYLDSTFTVAGLPRGILHDADLSSSGFAGVRFIGRHRYLDCRFPGADLTAIQLEAQARAHQFVRCDFTGARFDSSNIGFALFHGCNLSGTRWSGAHLKRVRFSECLLDGVVWDGVELIETRIVPASEAAPPMETPTVSVGAEPEEISAASPALAPIPIDPASTGPSR